MYDKLLTKKDLAERWQVSEQTIDEYRERGIIQAVPKMKSVRFNPDYIAEFEGIKLERFSPVERRRLENELTVWKSRAEEAERALADISCIAIKRIYKEGQA